MPANGRWDLIRRLKVKETTKFTIRDTFSVPDVFVKGQDHYE